MLCWSRRGDVLHRDAVRRDVMDLPRGGDIHQVVGLHLDFVSRWQKGVEAHNEVRVTLKELRHSTDHTGSVDATRGIKNKTRLTQKYFKKILNNAYPSCLNYKNSSPLGLKLFHDVQKVIVDLWLTSKLQLDLVQVGQGIFHL